MKKLVFSFALLTLFSSAAMAQVEFGLKAGPVLARTYTNLGDTLTGFTDSKISFVAGGFMRMPLFAKTSLQAEVLYANKGNKFSDFHYLTLPIMLQYEFFPDLRAEVGAEAGYLIYTNTTSINVGLFETHPFYRKLDIGLNFGLSYDFFSKFTAGLRYNLGVTDVYETSERVSFGSNRPLDVDVKNHTLRLSVGYRFSK